MDTAHMWMLILNFAVILCLAVGGFVIIHFVKQRISDESGTAQISSKLLRILYATAGIVIFLSLVVMGIGVYAGLIHK